MILMQKLGLNLQDVCFSERVILEDGQQSTHVRTLYWAPDRRLEFKHVPTAEYTGLKNEKWIIHRQIIVIVF